MIPRAMALVISLAACGHDNLNRTVIVEQPPSTTIVSRELTWCPHSSDKLAPLPAIRTTAMIADYANKLTSYTEKLESDLAICDSRRRKLVNMFKELQ